MQMQGGQLHQNKSQGNGPLHYSASSATSSASVAALAGIRCWHVMVIESIQALANRLHGTHTVTKGKAQMHMQCKVKTSMQAECCLNRVKPPWRIFSSSACRTWHMQESDTRYWDKSDLLILAGVTQ
jgi:hypothetical protein